MPLAVCATPIGNLDDVTLRVLRELAEAAVVLAEDTRHTRGLLERHGIRARLVSYHEHNEAKRTAELLPRLEAGERVALVSDAGLPGINDPGARLIAAALEAGVPVTVLPGPSAVETALVASGLVAERYQFIGYLPRGERALLELAEEVARWSWPVVAFESPQRLARSLRVLARAIARPAGGRLPRADETVRASRAGDGRGAGRTLRGTGEGRGHARARFRRSGRQRRGCRGRRRRGPRGRRSDATAGGRGGGEAHGRASEPPLSRLAVSRFDNSGHGLLPWTRFAILATTPIDSPTGGGGRGRFARRASGGRCMDVARQGSGPARVPLLGGQPARAGPAPRNRHPGRARRSGRGSDPGHGDVRRQGRGERPHGHDPNARRLHRDAPAPRRGPRLAGRRGRRGAVGRDRRDQRRSRVFGPVCPAGCPAELRSGGVSRPTGVPAAARSAVGGAGAGARPAAGSRASACPGDASECRRAACRSCSPTRRRSHGGHARAAGASGRCAPSRHAHLASLSRRRRRRCNRPEHDCRGGRRVSACARSAPA